MRQDVFDFEVEFEQALASYADPADAGHPHVLAARVKAAIDAKRRMRRVWLAGAIALPAVACLLVMVLLHEGRPAQNNLGAKELAAIPSASGPMTAPLKQVPSVKPRMKAQRREIIRDKPRQLPKLEQFPASTEPTEQERLLAQFVAHAQTATQQSVAKVEKLTSKPLHIAELSIPYLDSNPQPK